MSEHFVRRLAYQIKRGSTPRAGSYGLPHLSVLPVTHRHLANHLYDILYIICWSMLHGTSTGFQNTIHPPEEAVWWGIGNGG